MLPGFAFLFGLGSLFFAACNPKPRLAPYYSNAFQLEQQLEEWDRIPVYRCWRLSICIPPDYVETLEEATALQKPFSVSPPDWTDLAIIRHSSIAIERCKYFEWRCKKEGVEFDYATVIKYCKSFGPRCRKMYFE